MSMTNLCHKQIYIYEKFMSMRNLCILAFLSIGLICLNYTPNHTIRRNEIILKLFGNNFKMISAFFVWRA